MGQGPRAKPQSCQTYLEQDLDSCTIWRRRICQERTWGGDQRRSLIFKLGHTVGRRTQAENSRAEASEQNMRWAVAEDTRFSAGGQALLSS